MESSLKRIFYIKAFIWKPILGGSEAGTTINSSIPLSFKNLCRLPISGGSLLLIADLKSADACCWISADAELTLRKQTVRVKRNIYTYIHIYIINKVEQQEITLILTTVGFEIKQRIIWTNIVGLLIYLGIIYFTNVILNIVDYNLDFHILFLINQTTVYKFVKIFTWLFS